MWTIVWNDGTRMKGFISVVGGEIWKRRLNEVAV